MNEYGNGPYDDALTGGGLFWKGLILLGVALGAIGLTLGWRATFTDRRASALGESSSKLTDQEQKIAALEQRIDSISQQNQHLKSTLSVLVEQTQAALNQVGREIATDREQLGVYGNQIKQLASAIGNREIAAAVLPNAPPPSLGKKHKAPAPPKPPISGISHVVQPGETFSKIAKNYGVPLSAVLEANPSIDPRSLRVGQTVIVPKAGS